jgi:uncharacterized protein
MSRGFLTCLREGWTLFDAGAFHAAHEVWEEAWRVETGERRLLLQGLILVAAAWLKRDAGNHAGATTLFSRALERLIPVPPRYEGLDVEGLRHVIPRWREGEDTDRPSLERFALPHEGDA